MQSQALEDGPPLPAGEERQDVARTDDEIETDPLTPGPVGVGAQIELGQVPRLPPDVRMVRAGHLDQVGVDVHPDDLVAGASEVAADPTCPAARVEYPGLARSHGIDEPGFADDVVPRRLHAAPTIGVPLGVIRVVAHCGQPQILRRSGTLRGRLRRGSHHLHIVPP